MEAQNKIIGFALKNAQNKTVTAKNPITTSNITELREIENCNSSLPTFIVPPYSD